jgi:hypothetical protein
MRMPHRALCLSSLFGHDPHLKRSSAMWNTPRSRADQRLARCRGELLRGCGVWPSWGIECALEPPFEPFRWSTITSWDLAIHGYTAPYQGRWIDWVKRGFRRLYAPRTIDSYYRNGERDGSVHLIAVSHYAEDDITYAKAEQLLLALSPAREPVAFELFGIGQSSHEDAGPPRIEVRFAVSEHDVPLVEAHLHSHYPRSAVVSQEQGWMDADIEWSDRLRGGKDREDPLFVAPLFLTDLSCVPIRTYRTFETDPLGVAIAVMDELGRDEWALVQILFARASQPWADNLRRACDDPYRPGHPPASDLDLTLLAEKLETPLYAVSIVLAANTPRAFTALSASVHPYERGPQGLAIRDETTWRKQWLDVDPPRVSLWREALYFRQALTPGILLSARELAGLVHLPSPDLPAERLLRVRSQTRRPPATVLNAPLVVIGENVHRGEVRQVAIPPEMRARHCYIAGASGTGKSTLLLNMVLQDIAAGHGVGLLDPHGDLVRAVLRRIPEGRVEDVILFDPGDEEYPFALNIVEASEAEQERVVSEMLMALERYFPASWGPRLQHILTFTIHTVLHAVPGATLADVERMLTDPVFRTEVIGRTSNPQYLGFWKSQFSHYPKNAVDPVLNKLSPFLLNRVVRNIVCQRRSAIDFDALLNEGKILLANLSTGRLTEKTAGVLGSFLVTKIVNAAFRRDRLPEGQRRPWFLYIDEFQAFMNLSVGFDRVLAEARKYQLVLAGLANQYVGQLTPQVRQAVFGNVGSFIVFRLGIDDAQVVTKELGVFTTEDILNLELGQAIARVGGSASAFNLRTFPNPPVSQDDPAERIISRARQLYARPRAAVEEELSVGPDRSERLERAAVMSEELSDPMEEDLVV